MCSRHASRVRLELRLFALQLAGALFVIRAKSNTQDQRRRSRPVGKTTCVRCEQTVILTGVITARDYPQPLRRIRYHDANTGKTFNMDTPFHQEPLIAALFDSPESATRVAGQEIEHDSPADRVSLLLRAGVTAGSALATRLGIALHRLGIPAEKPPEPR